VSIGPTLTARAALVVAHPPCVPSRGAAASGSSAHAWRSHHAIGCTCRRRCLCVACCRDFEKNSLTGTIPTEVGMLTSVTELCVQCCGPAWLRGAIGHATRPTAGLRAYCLSGAAHVHVKLADRAVPPGCHYGKPL